MHSPSQCFSQDISHAPSECMGWDICTPFTAGQLGNIMCLSERMGWDICTPLHSGPAGKYHMPSECMGWDICTPLHNGPAGKYHMPSECMGWDICTPLHSGPAGNIMCLQSAWAGIYHSPSPQANQVISHASRDQSTWAKQCFSGDISLVRCNIISFYFSICSSLLEHQHHSFY